MTASGSSETGYIALSEAVKAVLFLRQVQEFMAPSIRILHASRRAKHVDVKHGFERDACDAGKIRVVYVKTENQHADMSTKPLEIHNFHMHAKTVLNVV